MKEVKPIEIEDLNNEKEIKAEDLKDVAGGSDSGPTLVCPKCGLTVGLMTDGSPVAYAMNARLRNYMIDHITNCNK